MSVFITACEQIFKQPLYRLRRDGSITVAIATKDYGSLRDVLSVVASCGQIPNTTLRIRLCCPEEFRDRLTRDCPLIRPDGSALTLGGLASVEFSDDLFPADCVFADPGTEIDPAWNVRVEPIVDACSTPNDELMRLTLNVNYVYQAANEKPRSFDAMQEQLMQKKSDYYSSMLQALHIPVKLLAAEADGETDPEKAAALFERRLRERPGLAGELTALEHRRWMAFLICQGWNCPTVDQVREYAFEPDGTNGFKFQNEKRNILMHPALVPCDSDGVSGLAGKSPDWWASGPLDGLDDLDKISVLMHRIALEKAAELEKQLHEKLLRLERDGAPVERLRAAVQRLIAGQYHAYDAFQEAMNQAKDWMSAADEALIRRFTAPRIEVNSFRDYKKSDSAAAYQLGFMLIFRKIHTFIAREMTQKLEENAIALVMTDPDALLICVPHDMPPQKEESILDGLQLLICQRNLRTRLFARRCANFRPDSYRCALEALCAESGVSFADLTFDLTGAHAGLTEASRDSRAIIVDGGMRLWNFRGCPAAENFNQVARPLSVENVFALSNRQAGDQWRAGNWGQIQRALPAAFSAYLKATDPIEIKDGMPVQRDNRFSDFAEFLRQNMQFNAISGKNKKIAIQYPAKNAKLLPVSCTISAECAGNLRLNDVFKSLSGGGFIEQLQIDSLDDLITYAWSANIFTNQLLQRLFELEHDDALTISIDESGAIIKQPASRFREDNVGANAREMLAELIDAGLILRGEDGECRFLNSGVRSLFVTQGNLLEDYVYQHVRNCGAYKSYALSYDFAPLSGEEETFDRHEVDVVAVTASNRSVFFSCKSGRDIDQKKIAEIASLASVYGFNRPIAVFVASCSEPRLVELHMEAGGIVRSAAEYMDVHIIDRSVLRDPDKFEEALRAIADS